MSRLLKSTLADLPRILPTEEVPDFTLSERPRAPDIRWPVGAGAEIAHDCYSCEIGKGAEYDAEQDYACAQRLRGPPNSVGIRADIIIWRRNIR